jgi:hypothetical protein
MGDLYGLPRSIRRRAGVSGTETFLPGTAILKIRASGAGGTVTMPKGDGAATVVLTIDATGVLEDIEYDTTSFRMGGPGQPSGQLQLVFVGTARYFVEYVPPSQGE